MGILRIRDISGNWIDIPSIQGAPGEKGDKGDKGDAGSLGSVSASVDSGTGTPSVVVTYDGTNANFAFHNLKGETGAQGATGADGYSPSASVSKSGNTSVITITDKAGTTTATVQDGDTLPAAVNDRYLHTNATTGELEWSPMSGGTGDFEQLTNRPKYNGVTMDGDTDIPEVPTKTSDLTNDSGFLTEHQSLAAYRTAEQQDAIHDSTKQDVIDASHKLSYNLLSDTPDIPDALSDLSDDSTHRLVTDAEKSTWNAKVGEAPSDSKQYARKNGAWEEVQGGSGGGTWGSITGTLSNQTDLQEALDDKQDELTSDNAGDNVTITEGGGHDLPSAYQEVEYLQASGTQYIDTGFYATGNTKVVADFKNTALISGVALFGYSKNASAGTTGSALNMQFYVSGLMNYSYACNYGDTGNWTNTPVTVDTSRHSLDFNMKDGYIKLDTLNYTFSTVSGTTAMPIYLFAISRDTQTSPGVVSNSFMTGVVYSFAVWDNGTLARNFVPCYRKSDSKPGMYDTVNDVFYDNDGTGDFAVGPDVLPTTKINALSGLTSSVTELNILDGATVTVTELNMLAGATEYTAAEIQTLWEATT